MISLQTDRLLGTVAQWHATDHGRNPVDAQTRHQINQLHVQLREVVQAFHFSNGNDSEPDPPAAA